MREALKPLTEQQYREHLETVVPPKTTVWLTTVTYRDDDMIEDRAICRKFKRDLIIKDALQHYDNYGLESRDGTPVLPSTLAEVMNDVCQEHGADSEWGTAFWETKKAYEKRQEEELRRSGEAAAASICSKYNVKQGTLEFISAVYRHHRSIIKRERHFRDDGESRAERWATCSLGGAGSEGFFSDNDFATTQIHKASSSLKNIIKYLDKYCPLLMARYRELKLQRKANR